MQNVSIQNANELPEAVRSAIEQLLGRSIAPDEEISVTATPPNESFRGPGNSGTEAGSVPQPPCRQVNGVPEEQMDAAIDEALDGVRHDRG